MKAEMKPKRRQICLLYGGQSSEHQVSCISAAFVMKNLSPTLYDVTAVAITQDGQWIPQKITSEWRDPGLQELPINLSQPAFDPREQPRHGPKIWFERLFGNRAQESTKENTPVVFPVLHGPMGEDGTIQGLCELADLAVVGSDSLGSAIAMNKGVSRELVARSHVRVGPWLELSFAEWQLNAQEIRQKALALKLPLFVKPCSLGSSVGISKVDDSSQLDAAITLAFNFDSRILIEQGVCGREFECAIIGTPSENIVSGVAEIVSQTNAFYSYEAKYLHAEDMDLITSAKIDSDLLNLIQQATREVFKVLRLDGMARIDFLFDHEEQQLYFNEANTIPGLTKISQFPSLWRVQGIDGDELCTRLIDLALKRQQNQKHLKRLQNYRGNLV